MGILPFRSRWLACYEREVYGKHHFRIVKIENPWFLRVSGKRSIVGGAVLPSCPLSPPEPDMFMEPAVIRPLTEDSEGDFGIEDLSWETVKKTDIGIEIGLWDCINIQADYFHEKRGGYLYATEDHTRNCRIQQEPWANFGIVKNQGFDASLEMNKSFGKDFFLSLRGNFTFSRNKILSMTNPRR